MGNGPSLKGFLFIAWFVEELRVGDTRLASEEDLDGLESLAEVVLLKFCNDPVSGDYVLNCQICWHL